MDDDWDNDNWDPEKQYANGLVVKESPQANEKELMKLPKFEEDAQSDPNVASYSNDSMIGESKNSVENRALSVSDILSVTFADQATSVEKTNIVTSVDFVDGGSLFTNSTENSDGHDSDNLQKVPSENETKLEKTSLGFHDGVNHGFYMGLSYAIQLLSEVLDHTVKNGVDAVHLSAQDRNQGHVVGSNGFSMKSDDLLNTVQSRSQAPRLSLTTSTPTTTPVSGKKLYTPEEDKELIRIAKEIREDDPDISDHKLFGLVYEKIGGTRSRQSIASRMQRQLADKWKRPSSVSDFVV